MKAIEYFVGQYPVSKTLRFELKPELLEGQTIDEFWNLYLNGSDADVIHKLYSNDKKRNDSYPIMKAILDEFHKSFIESALSQFEEGEKGVTWNVLAHAFLKDKKSKESQKLQEEMRSKIHKAFTAHEWWPYLSSYSKLIEIRLKKMIEEDDFAESVIKNYSGKDICREDLLKAIETFKSFSVYFGKYQENRNNMYSEKAQTTSIANRIVNENFPKFLTNISVYQRLKENCPKDVQAIEANLSTTLNGLSLDDVFTPEYYSNCLTQKGIEKINWLIGGNPNEGILGINSIGNQYLQRHPESSLKLRSLQMTPLYKQILSDRVRLAFLPQQFESDDELMNAISTFLDSFDSLNLFARIKETIGILKEEETDLNHIYVQGSNITKLSTLLYGSWNVLGEKLRQEMVPAGSKKNQKELDREIESWLENKCFSLAQIQAVESELMDKAAHPLSVIELFTTLTVWAYNSENHQWVKKSLPEQCANMRISVFNVLVNEYKKGKSIRTDAAKESLKAVLDAYMELYHVVELLRLGKKSELVEKDNFYIPYEQLFQPEDDSISVSHIVPLYMKVQSYLTRRLNDQGKIMLKFDSPTLADGWDANKENQNNATILLKNGKYFLLVFNPLCKPNISEGICKNGELKKIVYHQIADASKDIPNLMVENGKTVRKTGRKDIDGVNRILEAEKERLLPTEINRIRKSGSYLKSSDMFNTKDSQTYLAYYMQRIIEYKKGDINFSFKQAEEYSCYQDFIDDVSRQKYSLSLIPFSEDVIKTWMRKGSVFMFEITNKDLREKSYGTANIHTLYWKEVFSELNLSDTIFQLNGKAELFFRNKIGEQSFIHKKNSILVNKTFSNGIPIEPELYGRLLQHFNGKAVELSDEEAELLPMVVTKKAKFDIIKDKRYHEHKFFFHVPITINFKTTVTNQKRFNARTLDILRHNKKDLNIIGIDRGERNLIYVSVINQRGENLIPPRHFNLIETEANEGIVRKYDYLTKLKQTERNRDEARKNWTTMARIKDLKSGYLSQVVHEITKLMVRYNAIVVLEDLNFGFKRGRFNVERQVYQNFERMLIQKLNYLVFKREAPSQEYGNIRTGLQLTAPFTSFKELGKQTGWLFYVPAGYTSKIDPATGFVNLFNMNKPAKSLRGFFATFDDISYRSGLFYFTFTIQRQISIPSKQTLQIAGHFLHMERESLAREKS